MFFFLFRKCAVCIVSAWLKSFLFILDRAIQRFTFFFHISPSTRVLFSVCLSQISNIFYVRFCCLRYVVMYVLASSIIVLYNVFLLCVLLSGFSFRRPNNWAQNRHKMIIIMRYIASLFSIKIVHFNVAGHRFSLPLSFSRFCYLQLHRVIFLSSAHTRSVMGLSYYIGQILFNFFLCTSFSHLLFFFVFIVFVLK